MDDKITSDPPTVMSAWCDHFNHLSAPHADDFPILRKYVSLIEDLGTQSRLHDQEDMILDVPFSLEEVESSMRGLKLGKAGGWDQLH